MGRKVFQDFAHVLCQKFTEVPSTRDLVNLIIFGDGTLEMDLTANKARHNQYPVSPLPYMEEARRWLDTRLKELEIPDPALMRAALLVEYTVILSRTPSLGPAGLSAKFDFACTGVIEAPDRKYTSTLKTQKNWGVGQV
jgi:hypothetical protein